MQQLETNRVLGEPLGYIGDVQDVRRVAQWGSAGSSSIGGPAAPSLVRTLDPSVARWVMTTCRVKAL